MPCGSCGCRGAGLQRECCECCDCCGDCCGGWCSSSFPPSPSLSQESDRREAAEYNADAARRNRPPPGVLPPVPPAAPANEEGVDDVDASIIMCSVQRVNLRGEDKTETLPGYGSHHNIPRSSCCVCRCCCCVLSLQGPRLIQSTLASLMGIRHKRGREEELTCWR